MHCTIHAIEERQKMKLARANEKAEITCLGIVYGSIPPHGAFYGARMLHLEVVFGNMPSTY